jgi:hypothetical protein
MKIDSLQKNITGYVGWAALAIMVAVLQDVHRQIANGQSIEGMAVLDAAIVGLLPVLIVMLGSMKQPSVGHEPVAGQVARHEDHLVVDDPPSRPRRPNPDDERAAEREAERVVARDAAMRSDRG